MNIWHDVDANRIKIDDFLAVIEIKKGTKNKYELDKKTGLLILDRVLYTAMRYPANYGFIPLTLAEDDDPLDVMVVASEEIDPMALVRCYPVGAIRMKDGGQNDDKIIAIPFSDPTYNKIRSIKELSRHVLEEFIHFFKCYKQLEHKKIATNLSVLTRENAMGIIDKSLNAYRKTRAE
jgi:inorganic pyrophosphatase